MYEIWLFILIARHSFMIDDLIIGVELSVLKYLITVAS